MHQPHADITARAAKAALAVSLALLAALACLLPPLPAHAMLLDRVVAVVNNEAITWLELNAAMRREMSGALGRMGEEDRRKFLASSEENFIEKLIEKTLQMQEADRVGIKVAEAEVDMAVTSIRTKYSLDEASFRKAIESEGLSWVEYRKALSERLAIGRLIEREIKSRMVLSDEDLQREIRERGLGTDFYRLRQIFIRFTSDAAQAEEAERKLKEVTAALERGEDFIALALRYSEAPSAREGGDLGLLSDTEISEEFKEAIKGLAEGKYSAPFRVRGGYNIIKLEQKVPAREYVLEEMFKSRLESWQRGLRDRAHIDIRL